MNQNPPAAILSFPLMAAVQIMCARLGSVTGLGLAGVIRRVIHVGSWGAPVLSGVNSLYWTPAYAILLLRLLFWASYRHIVRIFKWLTLVLFAYIAAAFLAHPDWPAVLRAALVPRDVLHHPHRGRLSARARQDNHLNRSRCRRSAPSVGR
jgi:Mn2+/Fe2+ NRAMP family transporter